VPLFRKPEKAEPSLPYCARNNKKRGTSLGAAVSFRFSSCRLLVQADVIPKFGESRKGVEIKISLSALGYQKQVI
jgi:hypothetical protein